MKVSGLHQMADFLVTFQIFQKESNFGGSLLYCHINRGQFFPTYKFRVLVAMVSKMAHVISDLLNVSGASNFLKMFYFMCHTVKKH